MNGSARGRHAHDRIRRNAHHSHRQSSHDGAGELGAAGDAPVVDRHRLARTDRVRPGGRGEAFQVELDPQELWQSRTVKDSRRRGGASARGRGATRQRPRHWGARHQSQRMKGPFTAEHERLRDEVRRFVASELHPHADRWERRGRLPRRALTACAARGWFSLDPWGQAVLAEELPRCDSLGLALSVFVQANLIAPMLRELGSSAQQRDWLEPLLRGRALGALAVSEPDAGSDVAALQTTGKRRGTSLILDGTKTYITNAAAADVMIVAARTDGDGLAGLSLVLVPRATRGLRIEPLKTLGLTTSAMGRITLDRLPRPGQQPARPPRRRVWLHPTSTQPRAPVWRCGSRGLGLVRAGARDGLDEAAPRLRPPAQPSAGDPAPDCRMRDRARSRAAAQLRDVGAVGRGPRSVEGDRDDQGLQLRSRPARHRALPAAARRRRLSRPTTGPAGSTATRGR